MHEECGYQMIGGRNKRSDIASARQITASSSDKVQLDPKASNKKKAASGRAADWSLLTPQAATSPISSIMAKMISLAHGYGSNGLIKKCRKLAPGEKLRHV
jgi:hypothetical protein